MNAPVHMIPVAADGWHVPTGSKVAAIAVSVPAALAGALLTLSLYFVVVGLPLLLFAALAIRGTCRASHIGAVHPAHFVVGLGIVEGSCGVLALLVFDASVAIIGFSFGAAGALTGLAGWSLIRTSKPYPSPPPPLAPSWAQPSSPVS